MHVCICVQGKPFFRYTVQIGIYHIVASVKLYCPVRSAGECYERLWRRCGVLVRAWFPVFLQLG